MLSIPQIKAIEARDRDLADVLRQILSGVNALGDAVGSGSHSEFAAPEKIQAISVVASNGWFDIAITDLNPTYRGLQYFVEYDTDPAFPRPRVEHLGPSRNKTLSLGNLTLYWRAYSQYRDGKPSEPVTFGSPPTAVTGGGSTPPTPQASQGSGNGLSTAGGQGWGLTRTAQG